MSAMSKITLYGRRGWGSAIVEAQLEPLLDHLVGSGENRWWDG
jgi:hypothetical protein